MFQLQDYLYGCSIGDEVSYTAACVCVEEACISSIGTVVEPSSVRSQADMATPLCRICACMWECVCQVYAGDVTKAGVLSPKMYITSRKLYHRTSSW